MGKNIKYGEFTFPASTARPSARPVSTAKSTKGIPKAMYDAPHAMKDGGYAKGGPKATPKREPEAMVRKEVALLRKSGAPKALISHEVTLSLIAAIIAKAGLKVQAERDDSKYQTALYSFRFLALGEDLVEAGFELVEAGAWNNNGVPAPVGFLSDLEEAAAVILAKLDDDVLAFDLEFAQGDGLFHKERVW
jgi:hypothetical protein